MKWNVLLKDSESAKFKPYNIFDYDVFRLSIEELFKKQYPKDRFLLELEHETDYFFRAQIEWEMIFPPINASKHGKYNALTWFKIDVYEQLRVNWERFASRPLIWRRQRDSEPFHKSARGFGVGALLTFCHSQIKGRNALRPVL